MKMFLFHDYIINTESVRCRGVFDIFSCFAKDLLKTVDRPAKKFIDLFEIFMVKEPMQL